MGTSGPLRVLLFVGLLAATTLVVLLGFEVRSLRVEIREAADRENSLTPGLYVPKLELDLLDGSKATIGAPPSGESEVLFLFNTKCGFCRTAIAGWNQLTEALGERGIQTYGVSLDSAAETGEFVETYGLGFPSLLLDTPRSAALLRANAIPHTLLIDSEGKVVWTRLGVLSTSAVDSLLTLVDSAALHPGG